MQQVNWKSKKAKKAAETNGCIIREEQIYEANCNSTLGFVRGGIKIYRPDGKCIQLKNVKSFNPNSILIWSQVLKGFLCADIFCDIVIGFTDSYARNASVSADRAVMKMLNLVTENGTMCFHQILSDDAKKKLKVKNDYIHVSVQHIHLCDNFVRMMIDMGNGKAWINNVSMVGGNLYLNSECEVPRIAYSVLQRCYKHGFIDGSNLDGHNWNKFMRG